MVVLALSTTFLGPDAFGSASDPGTSTCESMAACASDLTAKDVASIFQTKAGRWISR